MNIRQTSLITASILALSFISLIGYQLLELYNQKINSISTRTSIEASSALNKAIIELSLERSVMQVTLNLDDPIQQQFKDLLDGQREKSDQGFDYVIEFVTQNPNFRRSDEFLENIKMLRQNIESIRKKADRNLRLPFNMRNQREVNNLPPQMKNTILSFSKLPIKLKTENAEVASLVTVLERIQYSAWAVREFGGRERTYMAIATATGRPFSEKTKKEMASYHAEAVAAMTKLELLSGYVGLDQDVREKIATVKDVYFGTYERTRNEIIAAESRGEAYPISFGDFFNESSDALGTAVDLSYFAGDEMVEYMMAKRQQSTMLFWLFGGILAFAVVLCGFQIYYTQYRVSGRILQLAGLMEKLTGGDTTIDIEKLKSSDEIGQMVTHVEVFRENAIEVKRLEEDQANQQKQAEEAKKQSAIEMANSFEARIGTIVESVENASNQMQEMSVTISQDIAKASEQSSLVSESSQAASTNVQTVASAAEEMSASITEISRSVQDTATRAKQCSDAAEASQQNLEQLKHAVEEIDSVIQAINDVAEQTNLLALNATIEAARAGDAGKGFAVVASEVKSLANETHKMTDEIATKIDDIKVSSQHTIESVNDIIKQIEAVDEKTANVSTAIDEQSKTTTEISQSATQAATGTQEVSMNIKDVQTVTSDSAVSAQTLKEASNNLKEQAVNLKTEIDGFLNDVRSQS